MKKNVKEMKKEMNMKEEKVDKEGWTSPEFTMKDDINPVVFIYKYLLCANILVLVMQLLNTFWWHSCVIRYMFYGVFLFTIVTLIVVDIVDTHNFKIKMRKYDETFEMLKILENDLDNKRDAHEKSVKRNRKSNKDDIGKESDK